MRSNDADWMRGREKLLPLLLLGTAGDGAVAGLLSAAAGPRKGSGIAFPKDGTSSRVIATDDVWTPMSGGRSRGVARFPTWIAIAAFLQFFDATDIGVGLTPMLLKKCGSVSFLQLFEAVS